MQFNRRTILAGGVVAAVGAAGWLLVPASTAEADVMVYKSPSCGCCGGWVDHMRANGFTVAVKERDDLTPVKARLGVPDSLQSCHTAEVGGYVVEGHVPAADIRRLLAERPRARGLAVPGMPAGSPGMEDGGRKEAYRVILFGDGEHSVYARH
ncbi:MAG: DUF411 domain-containing protein [Rhodospirillales bacterium]|nr:DUF411 domain-containing protein [Rhodospirillales bacterium]